MKRQLLFVLVLVLIAAGACFLTYRALAQVITKSVGAPACVPFNDYSGNHCYRITCSPSPDNYLNYDTCDGEPINSKLYGVELCEHEGVEIQNPIKCTTNPNSISYSWRSGEQEAAEQVGMDCPHTCKRCAKYPNTYGNCPRGYIKNTFTGCCDSGQAACTTPGYDGSCPTEDYYYNEYGMCCYDGGVCNEAYAPGEATVGDDGGGDFTPSPNLMEGGYGGCACDPYESNSCSSGGGEWSEAYCTCISPVVIDVAGDGFDLTDGAGGVLFDFTGDGKPERLAWTQAGSDDAWLFLDRNGNGAVDDGRELFGTHTPQPPLGAGEKRNGFRALAVYDWAGNGGNNDGMIDASDAIFPSLRLWQDVNHDGISEAEELHALASLGVAAFHLGYKESKRTDAYGNRFRYRAKVDDAKGGKVSRWAWDVFPVKAQ